MPDIKLPLGDDANSEIIDNNTPDLSNTDDNDDLNTLNNDNNADNQNDDTQNDDAIEIEGESYTLDSDGNAVDADGNIKYNKDDFEFEDDDEDPANEDEDVDTVSITNENGEELTYTLNENGDAITEDGTVVFTSDELAAKFEVEDSLSSVEELAKLAEIHPTDLEGNPVEYSDDEQGRRQYVEDVYEAGGLDKAQAVLDEYYESNPLIKIVSDYITVNGNLDGFNQDEFEVKNLTKESTDTDIISTIRQARKMKGDSEQEIAQAITWATNDNKLLELGKTSQAYIEANESSKKEELAQNAEQARINTAEKNADYINNLNTRINDLGQINIGGEKLNIPKILEINENGRRKTVDRSALLEYATEVHEWEMGDGSIKKATQYQIDKMEALRSKTIDDDIYNMIRLFTKQNEGMLLKSAMNNQAARNVKLRMKASANKTNPNSNNRQNNGQRLKLKYNK